MLAIMIVGLFMGTKMAHCQGTVPAGIHYQAVARDSKGEMTRKNIDVRFIIHAGSEYGEIVHQELHSGVVTSDYGVFSLIIGQGTREPGGTAASFSEIDWSTANHYLQVQVKFNSDGFLDMGSPIRFMAVPYAMYAGKSLEKGPVGPQGPAGPEASDDQTLSIINIDGSDYLAISGGNSVKISSIEKDGDPTNELQTLSYNAGTLSISGGNSVNLGTEVAFRARNTTSDAAPPLTIVTMTYDSPQFNVGGAFNASTGIFISPTDGIYTFNLSYYADGSGGSRELSIYVENVEYEKIAFDIASGNTITVRSVTIRLNATDEVKLVINTGTASQTGTGTFSGYKVY